MDTIEELSQNVIKELLQRKLTIATAESCTGGMFGSMITAMSGVSEIYLGGAITYSNQAKLDMISVKKETLEAFGAVSGQTAMEMAEGIRKKLNSSIGVSATGVAGPTGGTKEKPVGLVYIGFSYGDKTIYKELHLDGSRQEVRAKTCREIFMLIHENVAN